MSGETHARGLIDTNVVIHFAALKAAFLPEAMAISTVTLAELTAGPHHTTDPAEMARRMSILQHCEATFDPLPFDAESARAYGMICAAVLAAGRKPRGRLADLMIASTALVHKLPLYTINPADFAALDDLVTVVPVPRPAQ